ncbi:MAG: hypothetical protein LBP89_00425 [Helicobacteraceae bacterium]|jgi:hypothetical protein|nr:hypothetical protein [Helicobacteraceae bacterium]
MKTIAVLAVLALVAFIAFSGDDDDQDLLTGKEWVCESKEDALQNGHMIIRKVTLNKDGTHKTISTQFIEYRSKDEAGKAKFDVEMSGNWKLEDKAILLGIMEHSYLNIEASPIYKRFLEELAQNPPRTAQAQRYDQQVILELAKDKLVLQDNFGYESTCCVSRNCN